MPDTSLVFTIVGRVQSLIQRLQASGEATAVPALETIVRTLIEAESGLADAIEKMRKAVNGASRSLADIDHERHAGKADEDFISHQMALVLQDLQTQARQLVPDCLPGGTVPFPTRSGSGSN
jgi:hypothetical protein